ncbi:MAG: FAD-dependent oxidoreductase [Burkholderiales bacterium]|nr:FAD-dependent oxidoreductase [Burkholderiales bacterium]
MKRIVLLGAGHAHLLALKHFARRRAAGVEIVWVNPDPGTLYSGMIPGVIAGDYALEECRIDLERLARAAGARLLGDRARGLRPAARVVLLEGGAPLGYDAVSLDVGSGPPAHCPPAKDAGATHVSLRPLAQFVASLDLLAGRVARGVLGSIAVVGGGVAGAEVALSLQHRLRRSSRGPLEVTLISHERALAPDQGPRLGRALAGLARSRGIALVLGGRASMKDGGLVLAGGGRVQAGAVLWATGATAPGWLIDTQLALDARGFVAVNACLQSVSYPEVFAAGDCASDVTHPRPRSGVAAVRQGPVLGENLLRVLEGRPPRPWRMAARPLAILNCGGRHALASWRGMVLAGTLAWRWKDYLDRRFVRALRG